MKYIFLLAATLLLLGHSALSDAESQQVRVTVENTTAGKYQADVYYQPSDGRRTTGLGIRVHYPAGVIEVDGTSHVLSAATGLQQQVDQADHDQDSRTDMFVNAAWFDLNANWPSSLTDEVLLFRINFELQNPLAAQTVVFNVTRVSTATGYELSATPYQGRLGGGTVGSETALLNLIAEARVGIEAADDTQQIITATRAASTAIAQAASSATDEELRQSRQMTEDAVRAGMGFFDATINAGSDVQVRELLTLNSAALRFALDVSPALTSDWQPDAQRLGQAMAQHGLSSATGTRLAQALRAVVATDTVSASDVNAADVLRAALGAGAQLKHDALTGTVDMVMPEERYQGVVLAVRLVNDLMPQGLRFLADGRALLVHQGYAFEVAPVPADMPGFMAAVETETFRFSLRDDGAIELDLGGGERFVGAVAYNNLIDASDTCGAISIAEPVGPVNSAAYAFVVRCADGAEQHVLPYVQHAGFFNSQNGATVDRNTGIITIPGSGRYKPDFFVSSFNNADAVYYEANKNADGLALRIVDANGDGVTDYELLSVSGMQLLYGAGL